MNDLNKVVKYLGWFVVSFFVYFQFLIQVSSSIMQNDWAQYFHLDPLGVSFLSAAFFYTYLLFQIPVGVFYDQYSARSILIVATIGLGLSCILFANTNNYHLAVFARMLMGGCAAFGFIGMLKVTVTYFPGKQFSMMMGLSEAFSSIAMMVGVVILAWAISHATWQKLMMYFGIGVFLIMFLVTLIIKANPNMGATKLSLSTLAKNIFSAVTNPTVLITGVYGFFMASVVNAFTSLWGVAFLTEAYPISSQLAAKLMSTVFLGLAIGCPINGYFSKKYGLEREAMKICSILCALCMAVIIYVKMPLFMLYILFLMVGLLCAIYVQAFAIVGQSVPVQIQATSMSVTNMLIMASAPVLQIVIGAILKTKSFGYAISEHQNYQIALSILPLGMFIAFLLCFFIKTKSDEVIFDL